jgi:hypothetical protein
VFSGCTRRNSEFGIQWEDKHVLFRGKRSGVDELGEAIKPVIAGGNIKKVKRLFDDLAAYCEDEPQRVEAYMGFAILVCTENGCTDIIDKIEFFLEKWPHSISPVRVEYASLLADSNHEDMATHLSRDYLYDLRQTGTLEKISEMDIARTGAGRAFQIMTSAYTKLGARSYSKRVLDYALGHGAFGKLQEAYMMEKQRIDTELKQPRDAKLDAAWERFFESGRQGHRLIEWCDENSCPKMAQRVELIWQGFRFRRDYRVDASEILKHVKLVNVKKANGNISQAWALV